MKGKLPTTGVIVMASTPSEWRALFDQAQSNNVSFLTSGVIMVEGVKKFKIEIEIERIQPPESLIGIRFEDPHYGPEYTSSVFMQAMKRMYKHLDDVMKTNNWLIFGRIPSRSGGEDIPIMIYHYANLNVTFYTQKLIEEKRESFFFAYS